MSRSVTRRLPKTVFSLPMVILLIGVVGLILLLLYQQSSKQFIPGQSSELLKQQYADRRQAEFQQMLHAQEVVIPDAVLKLATELAENGYGQESEQLLTEKLPYPAPSEVAQPVAELRLKNSLTAYYTANLAGDKDVPARLLDVRARLQSLGDPQQVDVETLASLAKQCADFGLLPQAASLYANLALRDGSKQSEWWAEAAKWASQGGDELSAETYLHNALQQATDPNAVRLYTYAWLKQAIKAGKQQEVEAQMRETAPQLANTSADLQQLASISEALGRPELTSDLYASIAEQDAPNRQKWLEKTAYWAERAELYPKAATTLQQALDVTTSPSEIHALNMRLLELWMKAKQPAQAVNIAQRLLDPQTGDWDLLEKGINVALAAKDISQAQDWNKRFLEFNPNDAKAYLRQTDIEILAKDFPEAAKYIKEAVRLDPDNTLMRERWAYIAERNGDKSVAMDLWQWLYEHTGDAKFRRNLVQTAHGSQEGRGLDYLVQMAQTQTLPSATVMSVFSALAAKSPEQGESFMRDYLERNHVTDMSLWQYLSDWQLGQQRLDQALDTWQRAEASVGASAQTRLARLQILWQLQQPEQAGAILASLDDQQVEAATPYQLEILSELSWQQKDYAHAVAWYSRLLERAKPDTAMASRVLWYSRIAEAYKATGQLDAALQTLQTAWQGTQQPELLLNALQMAIEAKQPDVANQWVALAEQGENFELQGRYWLLRAQLASQQNQTEQARQFYQHLLLVEKDMTPLRKQALLQYLELTQKDQDGGEFERVFSELDGAALDAPEKARLYEIAFARALERKDDAQLVVLTERANAQGVTIAPWLQLASAMQRKDKAAVAQLLKSGAELALGDRFSALVMLGREDEAYQTARHAMKTAATAEEREQAKTLALSLAQGRVASVDGGMTIHQMDGLSSQEQRMSYHKGQANGMPGYSVEASRTRLSGKVVPDGVQHETDVTAGLHWQQTDRQADATVGVNQREGSTRPHANLRYSQQLTDDVSGNVSYGYQENPNENAWLRANAMRNQAQAGVDVDLGHQNHAQLSVWQSDFADRATGQDLASSNGGRAALVHREQFGQAQNGQQQEWYAGVQGSAEYFEKANGLDADQQQGIPDDTRSVALLAGVANGTPGSGIPPQDDNWRYNVSGSVGKQLTTGSLTKRVEASVGKRVSQDDELSAGAFYGTGDNTGKDYGIFMQYRKWLDFMDEDNR
jgi:hypothetical protein